MPPPLNCFQAKYNRTYNRGSDPPEEACTAFTGVFHVITGLNMNYGESLGYWYLRLNGFIPITNFVLHRPEPANNQNADTDILAVRFPHVYEVVGGQHKDWDNERFMNWGLNHDTNLVAIIAEVKTGRFDRTDIATAFSLARLEYAIARLGLFPREDVTSIASELMPRQLFEIQDMTIAKLLITSRRLHGDDKTFLRLTIPEINGFIRKRMLKYRRQKEAARMFFGDPLAQFFAAGG